MKVEEDNIGIYIGQYKNNKRNGIGRFVIGNPEKDFNTIIEG